MAEYAFNPLTGNLDRIGDGGGGGGSITITTDQGTPITGDSFFIEGQEYKDVPVMEVTNDGNEVKIANNAWMTPYVVSRSTADGEKGTFSTIQDAINAVAANSDNIGVFTTIYIRPNMAAGLVENLVFPAGNFHLMGLTPAISEEFYAPSYLNITITTNIGSNVVIENISVRNATNPALGNFGMLTFLNCDVEGYGNNGPNGILTAYDSNLSYITISQGQANFFHCFITPNSGFIGGTAVFQMKNCTFRSPGGFLQLLTGGSGSFADCIDLNIRGDVTGDIQISNCSLAAVVDLPNATIQYNNVSCSPSASLTEFFTTPFNLLQKKPSSMGNVMKRRPSNIGVDVIGWADQYVAFVYAGPQAITFDSGLVSTEQMWYLFDEAGNAGTYTKTISAGTGKTINGQPSIVIDQDFGWVIITYDGSNYFAFTGVAGSGVGSGGDVLVTKYETPGTYTWTKNPNSVFVELYGWGAGSGGGGGGTSNVAETPAIGGSGGSGIGGFYFQTLAANLGATETVVVGAGGLGGAGATTPDSIGDDGQIGGATSFGRISTLDENLFPAYPGGIGAHQGSPGYGGGAGLNWNGGRGQAIITNFGAIVPAINGGLAAGYTDAGPGDSYPSAFQGVPGGSVGGFITNIGGGGGGAVDVGGASVFNSADGGSYLNPQTGTVLLAGGYAGGGNGINGGIAVSGIIYSGTGGGGGNSVVGANGQNGGRGGNYGGGGGGGGGAANGFTAGNGGNGGDGAVWVVEHLKGSGGSSSDTLIYNRTATATNYSVLPTDELIAVTSTAAVRTISLPDVTDPDLVAGQVFIIKDESLAASTNNIVVNVTGGGTIDGLTTQSLNMDGQSMTFYFSGTNYFII